ncbi:hypothetical protein ACQBAR_07740 [Propionibacteriaceae bacterium Y1685]|uniref:hypothetical protein n=1 Tax=Microlunatus sp. Y1700 TaxID=3418487 RepID=UPI003B7E49C7
MCEACPGSAIPRAETTREGWKTMKYVKKIFWILVVTFGIFYLVTRPEDAAGAVRGAFMAVGTAFTSIFTFFASLAG